jgi:hypothetical protein
MDLGVKIKTSFAGLRSRINSSPDNLFVWLVFGAYMLVLAANLITHEMWRDELYTWTLALDSNSLSNLLYNKNSDGQPALWYFLVYFVTRLTKDPAAMQMLHFVMASGAAYIFLRFAPFEKFQKLLFVLGYFIIYEYATISRNYAIGIFLVFCFCALFAGKWRWRYPVIFLVLSLLCQTHLYGFMAAGCLLCFLMLWLLFGENKPATTKTETIMIYLGVALVVFSLLIAAITTIPQSKNQASPNPVIKIHTVVRFQKALAGVFHAFVPLPRLKYSYWNTTIIKDRTTEALLALPLLAFTALLFARKKLIFMLFILFTASMLGFRYFVHLGYIRHSGFLFIMFIAFLWLSKYYKDDVKLSSARMIYWADFGEKYRERFIYVLLIIHFATGLFASGMEWFCPFSTARDTAKYIKVHHLDILPICGDDCTVSPSVAGYLGQPIYYPGSGRTGSFMLYSGKNDIIDISTLIERAKQSADNKKSDVLLVLNYKLSINDPSIIKIAEFNRSIVADEEFYLYLLKYNPVSNDK